MKAIGENTLCSVPTAPAERNLLSKASIVASCLRGTGGATISCGTMKLAAAPSAVESRASSAPRTSVEVLR